MEERKILYSAIQPTNNLTIGNYIGPIRNWISLQNDYNCFFAVANMHAITVRQVPAELRQKTLEVIALYIACGVDPEKCVMYVQSHVPAHAELCWVLNTFTYVGEMERMTQFKDKSLRHAENIKYGADGLPRFNGGGYPSVSDRCRTRRARPKTARRNRARHRATLQQRFFAHVQSARSALRENRRQNQRLTGPRKENV